MKIKLNKEPWYPEGYTIESNEVIESFDPSELSLHLEPEQKENTIKGNVLAERMKGKGLNSNVLKYFLDNPEKIPAKWRGKLDKDEIYAVYFWGTILRSPDGNRHVLYLYRGDAGWHWRASWLGHVWYRLSPSALLASSELSPLSLELRLKKLEDWATNLGMK